MRKILLLAETILLSCLGVTLLADCVSAQIAPSKTEAEAVAEFYRQRRDAVRQMDGEFFKQSHLTPEQEELFIKARIDTEDNYRQHLTQTKATGYRYSELWDFSDAALSKAFDPEFGKKYREFVNTRHAREMIVSTPNLKAHEWLTNDEIDQLAKAWGPAYARLTSISCDSVFKTKAPTEKLAIWDGYVAEILSIAKPILPEPKFLTLQEIYTTARPQVIDLFEKGEE